MTHSDSQTRLASLDQLRGYAIFGMLVVNYFGHYRASWDQLRHHFTGFHYADTIAPLFVFVVGMGLRLSWLRRSEFMPPAEARRGILKRYAILVLIAFAVHAGYLWDALMYIGLAGLVGLWLVDKSPGVRLVAGLAGLTIFQAVFSFTSYGDWLIRDITYDGDNMPLIVKAIPLGPTLFDVRINGGPLGFVAYVFTLMCGTLTYDLFRTRNTRVILGGCLSMGVVLFLAGLASREEWGGLKSYWPYSQFFMTAPYVLSSTGLAFLTAAALYLLNDVLKIRIPHFTSFGMNPLFIYIVHFLLLDVILRFYGGDSENWPVIFAIFLAFYAVCYGLAYTLHRKEIYIKL